MSHKRWAVCALSLLLCGLLLIAALVVIVDPFEIYHQALFYVPPYKSKTQMYTNAGVAKSYDYDSVIFGSSVTENCRPSLFDEALGGHFVKLCTNAGSSRDHAKMMEIALRTHDVRQVVYSIDLFAFSAIPSNQKAVTPDYLYDDNVFNDVQYLFNLDVLLDHVRDALSRAGSTQDPDVLRDWMYFWNPTEMPGEQDIASRVDLSAPIPEQKANAYLVSLARANVEENLLPYIRNHPDTQFTFFFPPYCLMYWAQQAADGALETALAQKQVICELLLAEPNVSIHDFQINEAWTRDYAVYYDLIHYVSVVNDQFPAALAEGAFLLRDATQAQENIALLRDQTLSLFSAAAQ